MAEHEKSVVVLGGGVGGVVTARLLRKGLPSGHRVILVDRNSQHLFAPSLLWLLRGDRSARQIVRPLDRLSASGIEVVIGEVSHIDPASRVVRLEGSPDELSADYLVVSLGAEFAPETIPGLAEAGHAFYTLAGAESLRDALGSFQGGQIVVLTAAPAYKCPAAPYEAAMLIEDYVAERELREGTMIDVYAAEPAPMGVAGPDVSAGVRTMMETKGISYHPDHQVIRVDSATHQLHFANGTTAQFDLLGYVPPHRAPAVVETSGLSDESGWIPVDRRSLETRFPHVYAIGDNTTIPLMMGKPLPKAGVFAEAQAKVVAHNVVRDVTGKDEAAGFDGHGGCFVEAGGGRAAFGRGDFYAEPTPQVTLHPAGRRWHLGKVMFEKWWLTRWL